MAKKKLIENEEVNNQDENVQQEELSQVEMVPEIVLSETKKQEDIYKDIVSTYEEKIKELQNTINGLKSKLFETEEKLKSDIQDSVDKTHTHFNRGDRVFIKNRQSEPFYVQEVIGISIKNEPLYKVNSLVQDIELVVEESKMFNRLGY